MSPAFVPSGVSDTGAEKVDAPFTANGPPTVVVEDALPIVVGCVPEALMVVGPVLVRPPVAESRPLVVSVVVVTPPLATRPPVIVVVPLTANGPPTVVVEDALPIVVGCVPEALMVVGPVSVVGPVLVRPPVAVTGPLKVTGPVEFDSAAAASVQDITPPVVEESTNPLVPGNAFGSV